MDISSLNMQSSLLAAVYDPLYPFLTNQENTEALLTTTQMKRPRECDGHNESEQEPLAAAQALIKDNGGSADKALMAACEAGLVDVVACLVKELGANATTTNGIGWAPIHIAASGGFCEVVRTLVGELGVNVNANDIGKFGKTALHRACVKGHCAMVRVLVKELGADVNVLDRTGGTPLCDAARHGHEAACVLVKELGADANTRDKYGNTLLHDACANGHLSIVRLLASMPGVNVEAKNDMGDTPLHVAANFGNRDMMRILVKGFDANVGPRNCHGDTPLHVAVRRLGDHARSWAPMRRQ